MGIEPGTLHIPDKHSSYILTNNLVKTTLSHRVVETLGKNELYHQSGSPTLCESLPAKASNVDTAEAYNSKEIKAICQLTQQVMLLTMENRCQTYANCLNEIFV